MDQITPGMTYGLTALSLAIYAMPLLIIVWQKPLSGPGSRWSFFHSDFVAARRQQPHRP
jgi:hypothetical protein